MGIKEFATNFSEKSEKNIKRTIATFVAGIFIYCPSIYGKFSPDNDSVKLSQGPVAIEKLANDNIQKTTTTTTNITNNFIPLESKAIIENLAISNRTNATYFYDASTWINGRENFFYLRYPLLAQSGNQDQWGSYSVNKRMEFYMFKKPNPDDGIPQYIANGNESNSKYNKSLMTYETVNKALTEALKNKKQMANFSIKENKDISEFELKVEVADSKLISNRNINLVIVSYLDYANNTSPDKLPKGSDHPDYIYQNVAREFPFDVEGKKIMFKKDGILEEKFRLKTVSPSNRQQSGFVVFIQDMSTKEILATGICRLANLDGIDKPMYLNWNNQPENIRQEEYSKNNYEKIKNYTGLQEMTLNVKDIPTNTDLKKIALEIGKSGNDSDFFDIFGYTIPQSLQENIKYLDFDPDTSRLEIEFIRPLTHLDPETPIFTYITHFKKNTHQVSFNFQSRNLQVLDSNNCIPYFYLNNPKIHHRNQLLVSINPLDFNKDTWINEHDLSHLIDRFGTNENDKNWDPIYDIHQGGVSKGRIDIGDIRKMINENNRQNRFKEIIKEQNPDAELDSISLDIKSQVVEQLSQILPPSEIPQEFKESKPSKSNLLQSIFSFFKKK